MANGHGGRRNGSGRPPGRHKKNGDEMLGRFRRATAAEILAGADEVQLWRNLLTNKDKWLVLSALRYLTDRRDGKAYQGMNPLQAQRLSAGDDPKLAAVLQNLLHQPGTAVELTEKKARITSGTQALENINAEGKAKRLSAPSTAPSGMPVTLDASATSQPDPSGRKTGVGHFGAESHTERNQDSGDNGTVTSER